MSAQVCRHARWGWVVRLANNEVEAVIAPERGGRLMHYSRLGEPNLLWTARNIKKGLGNIWGWKNWGGEKNWLWPQDNWPGGDWPPPPDMEQAPWRVTGIGETLRDEIPVVEVLLTAETTAGKMERRFHMPAAGTRLDVSASLEGRDIAFGVWSVIQIPVPETVGVERVEPRRLLLQMPGADSALVMRGEDTLDLAATPSSVKGKLDADAFRVPTAQGVFVVRQHLDGAAEYEGIYRAHVQKSHTLGGDAFLELEFAAPIPGGGEQKSRQSVSFSME